MGDSYDNALAESVNALYKKEVIAPNSPWSSVTEVILATSEWVSWYDNERLHSWCGNVPPREFEEAFWRGSLAQHPAA
jgi:transposase InsO family protein